jgi:hypothetical protein
MIVDIETPAFKIICEKNVHMLDQATMRLAKQGWYPVGGVGRKGHEWVQVLVKEKE